MGEPVHLDDSPSFSSLMGDLERSKKEERWKQAEKIMEDNAVRMTERLNFNIGGTIFTTSKKTLLTIPDTFFHLLVGSGRWLPPSAEAAYFIDRDPAYFGLILNFLREPHNAATIFSLVQGPSERMLLWKELDFYLIPRSLSRVKKPFALAVPLGPNVKTGPVGYNSAALLERDCSFSSICPADDIGVRFRVRNVGHGRCEEGGKELCLGLAVKSKFRPSHANYFTAGWFLWTKDGSCWSESDRGRPYLSRSIPNGCLVTLIYSAARRTISFSIDDYEGQVAFTNVDARPEELYPAVDMCGTGGEVEIVIDEN